MSLDRLWIAPHGLHVEPARLADAEALARLHAASFYRGWPREEFATMLGEPNRTPAYVACDARRAIAGFLILRVSGEEAEVLSIAVAQRWRGRGVGAALLRAGIEDLRFSRARSLFLEVAEDNPPALALYRRAGFGEVGRRKGYYARQEGAPATALVMRRDLG